MTFRTRWALSLLLACTGLAPARAQDPPETGERATAPAPDPASVFGKLLRAPLPCDPSTDKALSIYKPDTLYQYIDGGADVYLLYDFRELLHADLSCGKTDVTVDVYDMGSVLDAFGIYSSESAPNYTYLAMGTEGYRNEGILNFYQDRYYVKLAGFGEGADALLGEYAKLLSERMGGARSAPALLAELPNERRVAHTEQYVTKDPLGHAFLAPAYLATYKWGSAESKLAISVAEDAADANARLEQLAKHFAATGTCEAAAELGEKAIRGSNSYEGAVLAAAKGKYVVLLLNPPADGASFLKSVENGLK